MRLRIKHQHFMALMAAVGLCLFAANTRAHAGGFGRIILSASKGAATVGKTAAAAGKLGTVGKAAAAVAVGAGLKEAGEVGALTRTAGAGSALVHDGEALTSVKAVGSGVDNGAQVAKDGAEGASTSGTKSTKPSKRFDRAAEEREVEARLAAQKKFASSESKTNLSPHAGVHVPSIGHREVGASSTAVTTASPNNAAVSSPTDRTDDRAKGAPISLFIFLPMIVVILGLALYLLALQSSSGAKPNWTLWPRRIERDKSNDTKLL